MRLSRRTLLQSVGALPFAAASRAHAAAAPVLVCLLAADPTVLIPGVSAAFATRFVGSKLYRGLMRWEPDGRLEPDLAAAAAVSADALTYLFRLQPGLIWHDSGGLDAADVVFSLTKFHAALQPGLQLDRIRVEAPDAQSIAIHLTEPGHLPMAALTGLSLPIVPQHVHDVPGWALDPRTTPPVGSGPFRMDGWLHLVRFDWYVGPKPALEAFACRVVPGAAAQLALAGPDAPSDTALLITGDAVGLASVRRFRLLPNMAVEAAYPPADRSLAGLRLNPAVKPLDLEAVRLALACAIDRARILRDAWSGIGHVATGPLLAGTPGRNDDAVLPDYAPRDASDRLNAAGLRPRDDGMRASLTYLHPPEPPWSTLFAILRISLGQIGIDLSAEPVPADEWARRVAIGDYQITGFCTAQTGDPAADMAAYAAALPDLEPLLAGGQTGLHDAQALLSAKMPRLWLVEPGVPVVRDKRIRLPSGVLGSFADAAVS